MARCVASSVSPISSSQPEVPVLERAARRLLNDPRDLPMLRLIACASLLPLTDGRVTLAPRG